jgi:hypothetical protein
MKKGIKEILQMLFQLSPIAEGEIQTHVDRNKLEAWMGRKLRPETLASIFEYLNESLYSTGYRKISYISTKEWVLLISDFSLHENLDIKRSSGRFEGQYRTENYQGLEYMKFACRLTYDYMPVKGSSSIH